MDFFYCETISDTPEWIGRRSEPVLNRTIWIVGEWKGTDEVWTKLLTREGHNIDKKDTSVAAQQLAEQEVPFLLIISTLLVNVELHDILILLRDGTAAMKCPVMVFTSHPSTSELVQVFQEGAHEYLDWLTPPEEIVARVKKLLDLFYGTRAGAETMLTFADVQVQIKSRKVYRGDQLIKLTPKEYDLLCFMLRRVNHVCSREELLQEVWGYDFRIDTNVVDVYIRHLRSKLDRGHSRKIIHTVRGTGYMIN
ncbi:response regulator transcription factor [Paenibacillus sp. YPG26]|uniref:response regulator transcription factor n=1 Tax=Paenibacillus sp. YPG26 TaxID=2878915 RepID=UPI00203AF259|nr:response regulator transcription factor [Paenibacillus sp. YPG26]USB34918.1 response regulator transcription factor [Paenibacillus sp. YPG26]